MGVPVVVGLGDPVMDILARVSSDWLATVAPEPGGCLPVAPAEMDQLLQGASTQSELIRVPGGSAANVVKGIANISRGQADAKFVGMVGTDSTGAEYRAKLMGQNVQPLLLESSSGEPSACAVCFVTPDGQRTMRTCLGASLELKASSQVDPSWSSGISLLHCEGYCLYRPQLAREMMMQARAAGARVCIDLASFELVRNCRASLQGLLEDGLVDLVFANEEEAATLADELQLAERSDSTDVKVAAAQAYLLKHCQVAVTSLGARGCIARGRDGSVGQSAACRVQVVDTIGAGDFFTAGFLAAYLQGGSLQQCAAAGCAAGCEAVQTRGAELPQEAFDRLQAAICEVISTQAQPASPRAASGAAMLMASMQAGSGAAGVVAAAAAVQHSPAATALA